MKSVEALDLTYDQFVDFLRANHSAYLQVGEFTYYLTDVNDHAWRAQDTDVLNGKGHYTDCSDLVPTLAEFMALPFIDGRTVEQVFDESTVFASGERTEGE